MIETIAKAYKGKRILVTGHTGFKGAWLVQLLAQFEPESIAGFALPPDSQPNLYDLAQIGSLCDSNFGDVADFEALHELIVDYKPDFVFHLAAQALVRASYATPRLTYLTNTQGTVNLLDAVRQAAYPCHVVLVTTDKVYQNQEWVWPYRETDTLGGYDPYAASKAAAEIVIQSYRSSFFNPQDWDKHRIAVAVARAGNVIGGGDWSTDRLVPDILRALSENKTIVVRNPNAVRPWQHVLEPLVGYLLLGARLQDDPERFSDAYNFGPEVVDNLKVQDLVDMAISTWGTGSSERPEQVNAPHEANLLMLDISKAKAQLRWAPKWNSDEAILHTMGWYKAYYSRQADAAGLCAAQISQYLEACREQV